MKIFVLYHVYIDIAFASKHFGGMQYFAILRDTGESKRKEEFGKEICKSLRNEICKSQLA